MKTTWVAPIALALRHLSVRQLVIMAVSFFMLWHLAFTLAEGKASGAGVALDGPQGAGGPSGGTPTMPFGGGEDIAFSPDGSRAYFVARLSDGNEPGSTNLDIYASDLSGAAPTLLTAANKATK